MAEILPSIFGADVMHLQEEIHFLEAENTHILHVDLMDGNFVSNIAFGPNQISAMKQQSSMIFDVHMMVQHPKDHIEAVLATGAEMIAVHYESTPHIHAILQRIRQANRKAGVVINPGTSVQVLTCLLDDIDYILIMTINPGQPGQTFIPKSLEKIRQTKLLIGDRKIQIEVDGGVTTDIAKECAAAGAELIVVGGALFAGDKITQYRELKQAVKPAGKE